MGQRYYYCCYKLPALHYNNVLSTMERTNSSKALGGRLGHFIVTLITVTVQHYNNITIIYAYFSISLFFPLLFSFFRGFLHSFRRVIFYLFICLLLVEQNCASFTSIQRHSFNNQRHAGMAFAFFVSCRSIFQLFINPALEPRPLL